MVREEAEQALREAFGEGARFKPGQLEAIEALLRGRRLLVVQRTGWGKSAVYFLATRLLRRRGMGPTLIVSPLLSLIRNQMDAARQRFGLKTESINCTNADEWKEVGARIVDGSVDVVLVSPERLSSQQFREDVLGRLAQGIGMLVVDEAHCISDWGHDFRPDYRRIVRVLSQLPAGVPVLATTATANDRVVADVTEQVPGLGIIRGSLLRESLRLQAITLEDQAERLAWLARHLPEMPGSGIVYCLTRKDTERVTRWLQRKGIDAMEYNARVDEDEEMSRADRERALLDGNVKALVATVALGMGFDKPDLGFVVHFQRPGSPVLYYQQIGRAGRAIDEAHAVLLNGREDDDIQEFFISRAFPTDDDLAQVLDAIAESGAGLTERGIEAKVNMRPARLKQALRFLDVERAIVKEGARYRRTPHPWAPDKERARRVTALRHAELARMRDLVGSDECLMEFIARELDDSTAAPCGRCAPCAGAMYPATADPDLVREATEFLQGDHQVIEPRAFKVKDGQQRAIPLPLRVQEGRALGVYGDAAWGRLVRQGKYRDGRFSDDLVEASVELIRIRWAPEPFPEWVCPIPSTRSGDLVPDFAKRLARRLGLPFHAALAKRPGNRPQKDCKNSAQKVANLENAFEIQGVLPPGPMLLVDDLVDSRWTFTMAGRLLREAGSGVVHPFALATITEDDA